MASFGQTLPPGGLNGLLRSYGLELRGWAGGITLRYAVAVVLLLSAAVSITAAAGVGVAALFHWLEANYGSNNAYAITAGLLLLLGLIGVLAGILLLKRPLPPVPGPMAQIRAARQSVAAQTILAASTPRKALKADPVTEIMIGLAAACLVGWLVLSRLNHRWPDRSR
jgi:ethanolamine transporter EutH